MSNLRTTTDQHEHRTGENAIQNLKEYGETMNTLKSAYKARNYTQVHLRKLLE